MKSIVLNVVAATALASDFASEIALAESVVQQKKNPFGRKGVRTRLTKKQKAFNATKHKRQLKREQQQHARRK